MGLKTFQQRASFSLRFYCGSSKTATAAIILAGLFVEMLCYVLGRLHSSCVLKSGCTDELY